MEEIKKNVGGDGLDSYLKSERIRIGERIKSIRENSGLDAKTLAEKANIDNGNLSKIVNGKYSVGLDTLNKVANCLDMKLDFVDKDYQSDKKCQLEQSQRLEKKYTIEASHPYISKMHKLAKDADFRRDDTFHSNVAEDHIMYKLGTLISKDRKLGYEFLIEYKITEPRTGIYYGCKGLIYKDNDESGAERLDSEWERSIRSNLCTILNNTFPGKEFDSRFKVTDNVKNHTHWPFWITLNEDEDIIEVAARATKLIRNVYKVELKLKEDKEEPNDLINKRQIKVRTAFTQEAYDESINILKNDPNIKNKSEATSLFKRFITNATKQNYLGKDPEYELAWRLAETTGKDFAFMVAAFFDCLIEKGYMIDPSKKDIKKEIKWQCFTNVIMSNQGEYFGNNLAKQYSAAKGDSDFEDKQGTIKEKLYEILF